MVGSLAGLGLIVSYEWPNWPVHKTAETPFAKTFRWTSPSPLPVTSDKNRTVQLWIFITNTCQPAYVLRTSFAHYIPSF